MFNGFPQLSRALVAVLVSVAIGLVALPASSRSSDAMSGALGRVARVPAAVRPPAAAPQPRPVPVVPSGKGMWIWEPEYAEGGDAGAIIARARATGLTHLYVKVGSSVDGFTGAEFLDALLPVAHAAGIRIIGWDFPYFDDVRADVNRALEAINYATPSGDHIDGFSADVETTAEHVVLTPENAAAYGSVLREEAPPGIPLIATVPRPSTTRQADYPYADVVQSFDAIAPMVYWIDQPPDEEAAEAVTFLSQFGKPVLPIGQAYDGGLEGGPPGTPTGDEITLFINAAAASGAAGVSFWSWQHASDDMWAAIAAAPEVGVKPPG